MKNLRNNQYPLDRSRYGKLSQMAAVLAVAGVLHSGPLSTEKTSTDSSQNAASVASALTATIHEGLPIEFNANEQLAWSPEGSACLLEYATSVDISRTINGVATYFLIKQTGDSLNTLEVEPIDASREFAIASSQISAGNLPGLHIDTSVGIIRLNAMYQPITNVENNYGQVETIEVGVTSLMGCQNSIGD